MRAVCLICVVGIAFFLTLAECKHPEAKKAKEKFEFHEINNYRSGESFIEDYTEPTIEDNEPTGMDSEGATTNETCPDCTVTDVFKKYRLEMIKAKILAKLGMKHPPNITGPLPKIPYHILFESVYSQQGDEPNWYETDNFHATTEKVINFATKLPMKKDKSESEEEADSHFYFDISQRVMDTQITRAHLWIYIKPAEVVQDTATWVHIFQIWNPDGKKVQKKLVRSRKIKLSSKGGHWEQFDFKYTVHEWAIDPASNWGITVEAIDHEGRSVVITETADDKEGRPFLEIHTKTRNSRKKRAIGMICDEHTTDERCCRYPLTVDFEEFGWDWIIAPKMYQANYCAGDCPLNFLPQYAHTQLVEQADPSGTIGPCCTATKVSPITMLYFNDTTNIVFGKLSNMVVDSCGCS